MPQHQQLLLATACAGRDRRLEQRVQPSRRHSSLGYLPPAKYARQCTQQIETDESQNVRTESRGRLRGFSYSDPYRKEQERLLREGNINEIFQIEYDFLTSPQFEGRYDQAIDYAFDQGRITKKPTPRAAGLEASAKDTQNGFYL